MQVERCLSCGCLLTRERTKGVSEAWHEDGILPYCTDCQQKRFDSIAPWSENRMVALYIACVMYDTPFYSKYARDVIDQKENIWLRYIKLLKENDENRLVTGNKFKGFKHGEVKFSDLIKQSGISTVAISNRSRWGAKFGDEGVSGEYTDKEIEELESLYEEQAAEYKGQITARVDMSIREICVCRLEWKKCIGVGDSQGAKRFSDMIKDAMAREGMRAGDAKPLENVRVDSIVSHLEQMGAIENGKIVGKEKLIDILNKNHPKYHTSHDAVDCMMMSIINTMKRNNGEPEILKLPVEAQVEDRWGEFLDQPTEHEKKVMRDLGMLVPEKEQKQGES